MNASDVAAMSPEERRVRIAEICGWEHPDVVVRYWDTWHNADSPLCPDGKCIDTEDLPDYPNDLNAMAEAECAITDWWAYSDCLLEAVDLLAPYNRGIIQATAAQRAEAFLRVMG